MARKRMFRLDVLETDTFMDMPLTTQALYFHLNLRADDDGFIGNPNQIVRSIGASMDDLKLLIAKRFILTFEDGVIVIKHWRLHNTLSQNRYHETNFIDDKAMLRIKDNKAYTFDETYAPLCDTRLIEMSKRQTIDEHKTNIDKQKTNLDKNSIDKDSIGKDSVVTPKDRASNLSNYNHLKETEKDEYITYIVNHTELDDAVCLWMRYKDEKKPHSQNHYADTGMVSLLKKIYKMALDYGVAPVIDTIETSMGNNYQGIVWDHMSKQQPKDDLYDKWMNA